MNNSFCVKDVDGGVAIVKYQGSLAGDGDVVIPSQIDGKNVVAIAGNAFNRSDQLKSVVIPDGVLAMSTPRTRRITVNARSDRRPGVF